MSAFSGKFNRLAMKASLFILLLLESMYFPASEPVLASNKGKSANNCHGGAKSKPPAQLKSLKPLKPSLAVPADIGSAQLDSSKESETSGSSTLEKREEELLQAAFKYLKEDNLSLSLEYLRKLKESYPENSDYALFYSMALRRQDGEGWYRFQKWSEEGSRQGEGGSRAQSNEKSLMQPDFAGNALKQETWLLLAKPSANGLRRVTRTTSGKIRD
jgi:hypothetical protein